jgi:hypothetical protein
VEDQQEQSCVTLLVTTRRRSAQGRCGAIGVADRFVGLVVQDLFERRTQLVTTATAASQAHRAGCGDE